MRGAGVRGPYARLPLPRTTRRPPGDRAGGVAGATSPGVVAFPNTMGSVSLTLRGAAAMARSTAACRAARALVA